MQQADVAIIGGGIVGLASAWRLRERLPAARIVVFEKEAAVARHQSGRNSGVLHTGIYYRPGSLRARLCRAGRAALVAFCAREGIAVEPRGKVIVAVAPEELPRLEQLLARGQANGVDCARIDGARLRELEPHAAGIAAIHVPEAAVVDFRGVCERLAQRLQEAGVAVRTGARVTALSRRERSVVVRSTAGEVEARLAVNCAGLHADRVARLSGRALAARIVPFRGEYFELVPAARHLCRGLIYPVPDPAFPFLGVHFTRTAGGAVECGPNAVLALAREGYHKASFALRDAFESLTYPGFLRLARRHWRTGAAELWRSWSTKAFAAALQRLVPDLRAGDLVPAPAGVRAQALGRDGTLLDDFLILEDDLVIDVCNAPSPAATASFAIGGHIAERVAARLDGGVPRHAR